MQQESAGRTPFVPATVGIRSGPPITRVRPQPAFYFLYIPERWGVIGGQVLPVLGRMPFLGGVNNVVRVKGGAYIMTGAEAHAKNKGRHTIPFDSVPPSHGVSSYLYQPDDRPDLTLCYTDSVYPGSTEQTTDEALWVEFLQYQIAQGVVPPCPVYILEKMLKSLEKPYRKALEDSRTIPHRAADAERYKAEQGTIQAEIDGRKETRKPVSKRSIVPEVAG